MKPEDPIQHSEDFQTLAGQTVEDEVSITTRRDEPFFPRDDTETPPPREARRGSVEDGGPHTGRTTDGPTPEPIAMDQQRDGIFSSRRDRFHLSKRVKIVGGSVLAGVLGIGGYMLAHKLLTPEEDSNAGFSKEEQEARKAGFEAIDKAIREAIQEGQQIELEKIARLERYTPPYHGKFREFYPLLDPLSDAKKTAIEQAQRTALPFGSLEVAKTENSSDSLGKTPNGQVAFEIKNGTVVEWMGVNLDPPIAVDTPNVGDEVVKQVLAQWGFLAEVVNRDARGFIGVRFKDEHFIVINPEGRVIYADHKSFVPGIAFTDTILLSRLHTTFREFTEGLEKRKKDLKVKLGWPPFPRDIQNLRESLYGTPPNLSAAREQTRAFLYPEKVENVPETGMLDFGTWYKIPGKNSKDKVVKISCKYPDRTSYEVAYRKDLYETLSTMAHGALFRFGPQGQILATGLDLHLSKNYSKDTAPYEIRFTFADHLTQKEYVVSRILYLPTRNLTQ